MRRHIILVPVLLLALSGCTGIGGGDVHGKIDQSDTVQTPPPPPAPVINVPPAQQVDVSDLKNEIHSSADRTANQFSGLVNTSVDRIADQIKGIEANLHADLTSNLTATNNMSASLKLAADLKAQLDLKAQMDNVLSVSNSMQSRIGSIETDLHNAMTAQASIQAGMGNISTHVSESLDAKAGRDVNALPLNAVLVILLVTLLFLLIFVRQSKEAELREKDRSDAERDERQRTYQLLLKLLAAVPEAHREALAREIGLGMEVKK